MQKIPEARPRSWFVLVKYFERRCARSWRSLVFCHFYDLYIAKNFDGQNILDLDG